MQKANEKLFIELVEQHKGILYRIVQIYAYTKEDKQDLKQEILVQLWKSYTSFRGESKFSTWMYRVAVNTAITNLKREKRRPQAYLTENFPEIRETDYDNSHDLQQLAFYKAIQKLKPIEKTLIFLYLEDFSHREIAENLGISEVNARVKLIRAKKKIQLILKKNDEFGQVQG